MNTNKVLELTEELTSNLKKTRPNLCGVWILCVISLIILVAVVVLFWIPCLTITPKTWQELLFAIFSIGILGCITYSSCQFLFKTLSERQQENKKWQAKFIDAYGKLLEEEFKPKNQEKSADLKKKEAEREAELIEKRHELEKARLDYEIEKFHYRKSHVAEE